MAVGDASLETAYRRALAKAPGATRLIDVNVDYDARNVLFLFAEHTTIVRGMAVAGNPSHPYDPGMVSPDTTRSTDQEITEFREAVRQMFAADANLERDYRFRPTEYGWPRKIEEWTARLDRRCLGSYRASGLSMSDWLGEVIRGDILVPGLHPEQ